MSLSSPRSREVVKTLWPMTIPAHADFQFTSPFPLKVSSAHSAVFTLTLDAPVLISPTQPINIESAGVLSAGFARGWCRLPVELKLDILRHGVIRHSTIWPANANRAMHDSLFSYLQMTPEIAALARQLYFAENSFVILAPQEEFTMFRGWPPSSVRSLLRKITLMTWLEPRDNTNIEAIADERLGLDSLAHVEVRCSVVKFVRSWFPRDGNDVNMKVDAWSTQLSTRLPPEVCFKPRGKIAFDRLQLGRGGIDEQLLTLVDLVEGLIRERFEFGVSPGTEAHVESVQD
ncbi:hypothetical protein E8E11_002599 [Didymella keratinophila]|nr:hypothetical protein E8E11_002599 [Didymella keratinophila]